MPGNACLRCCCLQIKWGINREKDEAFHSLLVYLWSSYKDCVFQRGSESFNQDLEGSINYSRRNWFWFSWFGKSSHGHFLSLVFDLQMVKTNGSIFKLRLNRKWPSGMCQICVQVNLPKIPVVVILYVSLIGSGYILQVTIVKCIHFYCQ